MPSRLLRRPKIGEVAVILHLNAPEEKSEDEQITL
jgi:hypothetical protein